MIIFFNVNILNLLYKYNQKDNMFYVEELKEIDNKKEVK